MASNSFLTRSALGVAVALTLGGCASTATVTAAPSCAAARLAYVGTDGGQVQALRLDACTGKLASLGTVAQLTKPRWSIANPTLTILYVADDVAGKDGRGFVVPEDECLGNTRKGKQVLNVKPPDAARAIAPVAQDFADDARGAAHRIAVKIR